MMSKEFARLHAIWTAKRNRPYTTNVGRRHAKGRAAGVGQILSKSKVIPQVGLNKVYTNIK